MTGRDDALKRPIIGIIYICKLRLLSVYDNSYR